MIPEFASAAEQSIPQFLDRESTRLASRLALISTLWTPTYAELNESSDRLTGMIRSRCCEKGDRVALLMRHDAHVVSAAIATLKAGCIVVALNPSDPESRLNEILEDADATLVIADASNLDLAARLAAGHRAVLRFDDASTATIQPLSTATSIGPDDVAFLVYTSGSTGRPRAVMQTHRMVLHNALRLSRGMEIRAEDRVALFASLGTGQGVATTWCALLSGAALCPFPVMDQGVTGLAQWIDATAISIYVSSTSLYRSFIKSLEPGRLLKSVRLVRLASEPATSADFDAFCSHFERGCVLFSTLSSSETGNITHARLTLGDRVDSGRLPVGLPSAGVEILLLDERGGETPLGEVGEVVVRSRYLSPGYWRDAALTAERFSPTTEGCEPRLFRSGDLARRAADGALTFIGRKDARLKIRGYRVEPQEIEEALLRQPGVESAVVCAQSVRDTDSRLSAFIVLQPGPNRLCIATLRQALAATLPAHSIPHQFMILDALPLTAAGKVDREALRRTNISQHRSPGEIPLGETEAFLAEVWQSALRCGPVARNDDFFELAGDSLSAAVVAARIHAAWQVQLDLRAFAEDSTLARLAARIDRIRSEIVSHNPPMMRVPRGSPLPLSFAQERTWHSSRTPEDSANFTMAVRHQIRGPLDVEVMRESLAYVVARHEILRTTFVEVQGRPMQVVQPVQSLEVPLIDLESSEHSNAEQLAMGIFKRESQCVFDLTRLPLLRFVLIRFNADLHWLIRINHHIISDRWSWMVFFRELAAVYPARKHHNPPPLREFEPLHYADYAAWQRRTLHRDGHEYKTALDWWKRTLADAPPMRTLPCCRTTPDPDARIADGVHDFGLDADVSQRLESIARAEATTYFVTRLATFAQLLAADTGQSEIVIGSYFTNRSRLEVQSMFGFFSNLAALRFLIDPANTFRQCIATVKHAISEAHAHCEIPYEQLCEELRAVGVGPPELRLLFGATDHTAPTRFADLEVTWLERRHERMPWGFTLSMNQHHERSSCRALFDARIYEPSSVRDMVARYVRLLDSVSRHPDEPFARLIGG